MFVENEFSKESYTEIRQSGKSQRERRERDDRNGRGKDRDYNRDRGRDRDRGRNNRDNDRSRGKSSSRFVDSKGQSRLFIAKGKVDSMTPQKLVALIEEKSHVHGKNLQGVEIYDKFSFVNVSYSDAEAILKAFKSTDRNQRSIVALAK